MLTVPIIFSLTTILLYHVKQSLVVISLVPILVMAFLSIINDFNYKNIVYRMLTVFVVALSLLYSVKLWGAFMAGTSLEIHFYIKLVCLCIFAVAFVFAFSFLFYQLFSKRNVFTRSVQLILVFSILLVIRNFI